MNLVNPYMYAGAPAASDPYFSSVVLLMHCDGADASTTFVDSSSSAKAISSVGDAQVDTAQKKYGAGSLLLDASGDYLQTASPSADFAFGTSTDFTVETWVYVPTAAPDTINWLCCTARKYYFGTYGGYIIVGAAGLINLFILTTNFAPYRNKWTHVAHTRQGTTHRLFLDGVLKETATNSGAFGDTDTVNIGSDPYGGPVFNGWIDEVRITKGVARYTASFTPPEEAFPNS